MLNIYGSELPVELYLHICRSLGPPSSDTIKVLVNLLAVSSYIRAIVAGLPTWKELYEVRYTHDVSEKEELRRRQRGDDYCRLHFERRALDHRALRLVDEIRTQIPGRSQRALILAKELPSESHALPRSYWATAVQEVIARYWAVTTWHRAAQGDLTVNEEDVLAAWSAFFGWSPQQIGHEFDYIARECRDGAFVPGGRPSRGKVVWSQKDPDFNLERVCAAIIECMRSLELLRDDFNSYPHVILTTERDFVLTTFAKTWIFLAICRRLGLVAYGIVASGSDNPICVVRAVAAGEGSFLVDFASDPFPYPAADIPILKRILNESPGWLPPLSIKWFFIHSMKEAARNFALYNEHDVAEWSNAPQETCLLASHAAQCALATTTTPLSDAYIMFPENISDLLPLDGHPILLDALLSNAPGSAGPVNNEHVAGVKAAVQQLEDPDNLAMRRSQYPGHELGAVGKVVIHKQEPDGESAVIVGWKSSKEDSQRIVYKIATTFGIEYWQDTDFKYVGLTQVDAQILREDFPQLGRFVEDVSYSEVDSEGNPMRFLLTAEMRMRCPEDDIPETSTAPSLAVTVADT
ncbi:hypothetical protein LXA43DRAFT_974085 [Ganoderma leucocontextum]|nr:hypothetical protein LXA43DRAFT_974085 [Ganoderma leucocontextum]